jgi:hypothetical protein
MFRFQFLVIPPLPEGGGGYIVLPLSVCPFVLPSIQHIFRHIFLSNLMGRKTLPTIWGTYMKLVTKYQISGINSCWEKCDEKWAYMFNVYKNQRSRQTGSRNLTGPKTLPTIWYTYMKLVTKNQISAINSYWEKCAEKYVGHIGTPYCGKRFSTHQIPTSCLSILLIFIHI